MTPAVRRALEAALQALPEGSARAAVVAALAEFETDKTRRAGKRAALAALIIDKETGF